MRVLFFIEPVIFRHEPDQLQTHLPWADSLEASVISAGGEFALVSNPDVCSIWHISQTPAHPRKIFMIDPYLPLEMFGFRRDRYAAAQYETGAVANPLVSKLRTIRDLFKPDLVVMTSQNAYARQAFSDLPILSIEKAPLPRLDQPQRMAFDVGGHQTQSVLETRSADIKRLPLSSADRQSLQGLLESIEGKLRSDPRFKGCSDQIKEMRHHNKVALMATQPPDWITYEGAYDSIALDALLCTWEAALPPGWIGIPTYHAGYRLSPSMERAISRSCPRIKFLPYELGQGLTELLLLLADGVISISSTVSMTALLFGKPAIATGRCPFNAWCPRDVEKIATAETLTLNERTSLLAFLTNRYAWREDDIQLNGDLFKQVALGAIADPAGSWHFDFSDWSCSRAAALFNL